MEDDYPPGSLLVERIETMIICKDFYNLKCGFYLEEFLQPLVKSVSYYQ